jgi:hypothetical protein
MDFRKKNVLNKRTRGVKKNEMCSRSMGSLTKWNHITQPQATQPARRQNN